MVIFVPVADHESVSSEDPLDAAMRNLAGSAGSASGSGTHLNWRIRKKTKKKRQKFDWKANFAQYPEASGATS